MKLVVSSNGSNLDAPASSVFGRCPMYMFVDTDSLEFEVSRNPAADAPGGAGIRAAQFVTEADVQAVITGNVGPNAMDVLQAAGVQVYFFRDGSVRQAVEDFKAGKLATASGKSVQSHHGMQDRRDASPALSPTSRRRGIQELKAEAADVRKRLTNVLVRIDRLEEDK
jgi:predicted Fe-Mo cluster-binding NifX family protein